MEKEVKLKNIKVKLIGKKSKTNRNNLKSTKKLVLTKSKKNNFSKSNLKNIKKDKIKTTTEVIKTKKKSSCQIKKEKKIIKKTITTNKSSKIFIRPNLQLKKNKTETCLKKKKIKSNKVKTKSIKPKKKLPINKVDNEILGKCPVLNFPLDENSINNFARNLFEFIANNNFFIDINKYDDLINLIKWKNSKLEIEMIKELVNNVLNKIEEIANEDDDEENEI